MYLKNSLLRGIDDADIEYEDWQIDELRKCAKDPIYFILKYIKIVDGDKGLINFQPREYAINFIKTIHKHNYSCARFPRQSGKSLSVAAYMTWYVIFNSQKNALLLAHKKSMASEQLLRIKNMIQEVPLWMQQPILKWNESSIAFANGSRVACSATTPNAARGFTINFLYLDEFAFVEPHIANEFISSVFPIVSSMTTAKVVISSTPCGLNHFWKIWTDAVNKLNSGIPLGDKDWRTLDIPWNAVPGRDDEWRKSEIDKIGSIKFAQEYMCISYEEIVTIRHKLTGKIEKIKIGELYGRLKNM